MELSSIVVGIDGSPTAHAAFERALDLAKASGARLHIVSAYRSAAAMQSIAPDPLAGNLAAQAIKTEGELKVRTEALLDDAAAEAKSAGIDAVTYAGPSDAAEYVLDVAEGERAGLIVIGNRGMSAARRFILGSVPNTVSHHARCDVLIVHTVDQP